jgi:hypothetical protein
VTFKSTVEFGYNESQGTVKINSLHPKFVVAEFGLYRLPRVGVGDIIDISINRDTGYDDVNIVS